jgi:hypothetical protein
MPRVILAKTLICVPNFKKNITQYYFNQLHDARLEYSETPAQFSNRCGIPRSKTIGTAGDPTHQRVLPEERRHWSLTAFINGMQEAAGQQLKHRVRSSVAEVQHTATAEFYAARLEKESADIFTAAHETYVCCLCRQTDHFARES